MSTEDLDITPPSPISTLRKLQQNWVIKVRVLRRGSIDTYTNKKGPGEMWKVILIDDEGTKIQAVLFNDAVTKFRDLLWTSKTYMISNGFVNAINPDYSNVHKEFELALLANSCVVETESKVTMEPAYNFITFKEATLHGQDKHLFDVIGFVTNVKPIYNIIKEKSGTTFKMREVVIKNTSLEILRLILWGDLAENEGQLLENIVAEKPIIALSNVNGSIYQGEFSVTTLSVTTIQLNPKLEQTEEMRTWLESFLDGPEADKFCSPIRRITKATEVTIQNIVKGNIPIANGLYCSFKAVINDILNKDNLCYEACKACTTRVEKNEEGARCSRCGTDYAEYSRRYRVKLQVSDDDEEIAEVTLFDEAQVLIGCSAMNFPEQQQKKIQSKCYRSLISCIGKKYKFLIRLSKTRENDRKKGKFVAEEIEEIEEIADSDTETIQELRKKSKKAKK